MGRVPFEREPAEPEGSEKRFQSNSSTATFYLSNYDGDVKTLGTQLRLCKLDCVEFIKISKEGERSLHRLKFSHLVRPSKIVNKFPHLEFSDKNFVARELAGKPLQQ